LKKYTLKPVAMKKLIYVSSVLLLTTMLLSSCKKEETASFGPVTPSTSNNPSNQREDDCYFIPFTQTGANTWTVNQAGVTMTFTDLHIKSDGRLYGKLASSAPAGTMVITGGNDYNNREYAVEIPNCTSTYSITKSTQIIPYSLYTSLYGYNSFLTVNGQGAPGGSFSVLLGASVYTGIPLFSVSTGTATVTNYSFNGSTSCTSSARLIVGKLYAKGVQSHAGPNNTVTFTYTELGIASMCTPDEIFALEMN
jgi:hypothetical protein